MKTNYPVKIRNVVTKMKDSCQRALKDRLSRIEVELPPAADYGVSKGGVFDNLPDAEKIKRSNMDAARLFTEMFSMLSSSTVALFTTEADARAAKTAFGRGFRGQCLSIDSAGKSAKGFSNLRSRRFTAEEQEAALMGSDGIYVPDGTEVLIIVGPRAKDFSSGKLRKIHEKLGEDTLVILLNARVDAMDILLNSEKKSDDDSSSRLDWVRESFKPVFFYTSPCIVNSQGKAEDAMDLLQYYEYGDKWYVARQQDGGTGGVGGNMLDSLMSGSGISTFKTLVTTSERLGPRELADALSGSSLG
jgi:hypothetical protein